MPYTATLFKQPEQETALGEKQLKKFVSIAAMILWLAHSTRPDIKLCSAYFSTRYQCATTSDWSKLLKCARYLRGTRDRGLAFYKSKSVLHAEADASFGLHDDPQS